MNTGAGQGPGGPPDNAYLRAMIAISITVEAYQAIKGTLPEGAGAWPAQPDDRGGIRIWLDRKFVDRLGQMRGPGESYSDVILRLAEA